MASLLYSGNAANRDEERREIIFRLDAARLAIEDEAKSIEEELNASTKLSMPIALRRKTTFYNLK